MCVEGVDLLRADEDEALATIAAGRPGQPPRPDEPARPGRGRLAEDPVAANALLGTFTVDYHLDASSPLGLARPFAFGGSRTTNQLIFNCQPPLVRIVERNNYRSTLINYQQLRRQLDDNEDNVVFEVRLDLRNLRAAANNYQRVQKRQHRTGLPPGGPGVAGVQPAAGPAGPAAPSPAWSGPTAPQPQVGDPPP